MNLLFNLLPNIYNRLKFLQEDFLGYGISFEPIIDLLIGILISVFFFVVFILLGSKIRGFVFKTVQSPSFLIDIALGFIAFGTGIGIIGLFSLLESEYLLLYLLAVVLFCFLPLNSSVSTLKAFLSYLLNTIKDFNKNKFASIWVYLFILIGLLNLINPEIREDQYHVDFPKKYLNEKTIMVPPKEQFKVSASPMLSEMTYIAGIFLWSQESARYIHFLFYLLILITLFEYRSIVGKHAIYAPLIFATAPVVIHETSSMYVDFQWMFCFLLSVFVLVKNKSPDKKTLSLSGVLLGGMLASKLWTIVFIPIFILYILGKPDFRKFKDRIYGALIFLLPLFAVVSIWFLRSYILTGNPLFPADGEYKSYLGINFALLNQLDYINVFSPLFFIGAALFIYKTKESIKKVSRINLYKLILLVLILYLSIHYPFGRYLLGLYVLMVFVASVQLEGFIKRFAAIRFLLNAVLLLLFSYYLISAVLVLPYSFGITDKNKYLERIFLRDNSSYIDYGRKFDKYISKDDLVATYKIFGFYYAKFNLVDINFITGDNNFEFDSLKQKGVTKLFIRNGDINYYCKDLKIKDCSSKHFNLISSYSAYPTFYLYSIR